LGYDAKKVERNKLTTKVLYISTKTAKSLPQNGEQALCSFFAAG
jgi:hypothetical protein